MDSKIIRKIIGILLIGLSAIILLVIITVLLGLSVKCCRFTVGLGSAIFGSITFGWSVFLTAVISSILIYLSIFVFFDTTDSIVDKYF